MEQLTSLPAVGDVVQGWVIRAPQPTLHDGVQRVRGEDRFGKRREVGGGANDGHRSTVPEIEKGEKKTTNESMAFMHFVLVVLVASLSPTYCISNNRRILFRCAVRYIGECFLNNLRMDQPRYVA